MSPLLAVAIVLLVLVAGLALLQRRQTRDLTSRPVAAIAVAPPAARKTVADPASDPDRPFRDDPVLGAARCRSA